MNVRLLAFGLFFLSGVVQGQTYQVIKVAGVITRCQQKGDTLRMEDKVKAADTLCFTNVKGKYAVAAIIDLKSKERYILKASTDSVGVRKGIVKASLTRSRAQTGTRRGKINTLLDLGAFFGDDQFLILGGELRLEINPETLAMNADSFFYASYQYRGEKINKKFPAEGKELVLSAKELYQVDGQPIDAGETTEFTLYYYQPRLKKLQKVSTFSPVFLADEEVSTELTIIFRNLVGEHPEAVDREAVKKDLIAYLVEVYGKADEENLEDWLDHFLK